MEGNADETILEISIIIELYGGERRGIAGGMLEGSVRGQNQTRGRYGAGDHRKGGADPDGPDLVRGWNPGSQG